MRSIPAQIKSYAPGFALALVIALLAKGIEALLPFDVIGASVIAMFIGMLINGYRKPGKTTAPGVKFTAKKILKFAIILLGASLNVTTILNVGRMSLTVMLFTLLTCFGGGYFIGRALGLDWKLSNLISAGTGICGGSAIAAVAPVIDAKDSDIAYALSATFLFDMAMIAGAVKLPTIVFDEIDTGVSGEIADRMADMMQEMGDCNRQVISITHLPQIAARGRAHYKVYKKDSDTETNSHIRRLTDEERVEEIAHMLSGATLTEAALSNAKALLARTS